jgi:hypothetical protein
LDQIPIIDTMDGEDKEVALALLQKKLDKQIRNTHEDDLIRLVRQLDHMPLAITEAAASINRRAPRMTVSKYMEDLKRSDDDRAKLQQKDLGDPRRDGRASNSIIVTWRVSFEYIRRRRRRPHSYCAGDREAIPASLLADRYRGSDDDQGTDFEDDVDTLRSYGLVGIDMAEDLFNMHRLVQFSMKKWLELDGELAQWQERYIRVLDEAFPTCDYANCPVCQSLFSHVEGMVPDLPSNDEYQTRWAAVLYKGLGTPLSVDDTTWRS